MSIPRRDAIYLTAVTIVAMTLMLSGAAIVLWQARQGGDAADDLQAMRQSIRSDPEAARAFLDRVLRRVPDHIDARLLRAEMRLGVGESDEAISDYNHVLTLEPGHAKALLGRARARLSLADQDGAIQDISAVLKADPADPEALHLRAVIRSSRFENDLALADFDAAIERQPDRVDWRLERAEMRRETGRFAEAAEDFELVLSKRPDRAEIWSALAWCRWGAGDLDGAVEAFDEALKRSAENAHAHFGRGAVLLNEGRLDEAVASLDKARARPAQRVEYAALYAWIARVRLGRADQAEALLRTDLANDAFGWRHWPRRLAAFLLGEMDEETILELSREEQDGNTAQEQRCEALYYAGWKRLLAGDRDGAADLLRQCAAIPLTRFYEWNSARHDLASLDSAE